jgi:hypothetical protein
MFDSLRRVVPRHRAAASPTASMATHLRAHCQLCSSPRTEWINSRGRDGIYSAARFECSHRLIVDGPQRYKYSPWH